MERGGHIFWLHKDLRSASTESIAVAQFNRALRNLDACVLHDQQRKGTQCFFFLFLLMYYYWDGRS